MLFVCKFYFRCIVKNNLSPLSAPEITVETSPSTVRVLDIAPYNGFTLTCTASASADSVNLPLSVSWQRRPGSSGSFQSVDLSLFTTTGSEEDGYTSSLISSESMPQDSVSYRCVTTFSAAELNSSSTTTVTVAGQCVQE